MAKRTAEVKAARIKKDLSGRSTTGILELDGVLGGGFSKGAVILVSGNSGVGKTVLALEWLFRGATEFGENGIYITFTEPLFKTLKNLEGMSFYKRDAVEQGKIRILDLRSDISVADFDGNKILEVIEKEVKKNGAQRLVVDSVTAVAYSLQHKAFIRKFIFDLGTTLAELGCTTVLTSEVASEKYSVYGVEEFISDGIILLTQQEHKFQEVRTLQIVKMRGIDFQRGINAFRITMDGIKLFPLLRIPLYHKTSSKKVSIGVAGIDDMVHGGVFEGSTNLIAGSTGTGKSVLGLHFIWEGVRRNEPCLLVGFEESKDQIMRNARAFGFDFEKYEKKGLLTITCAYPSQKYIEEHLLHLKGIIDSKGIKRCVVDSLSSLGNSFEIDQFRYFVKRLNAYLKLKQVTSVFTSATASLMVAEALTVSHLSTMTDNIILLKYVEIGGQMKSMVSALKTRGDDHSKSLREFEITSRGIMVGESFRGYENVMAGSARKVGSTVLEDVLKIFTEHMGPIGPVEFDDLKRKGRLNEKGIAQLIDEMMNEGSLNAASGESMQADIHAMYGNSNHFGRKSSKQESVDVKAGPSVWSKLQFWKGNEK